MKPTIKDIAKIANVSIGTASLALNNKPGVSPATRERVREVAKLYHYTPNDLARALITKKSNLIGLIVSDIHNPFYAAIVGEFNKIFESTPYTLLLGVSDNKIRSEQKYTQMFISKGVDGVIITPSIEVYPDLKHLYDLKDHDIPFLFCTAAYYGFQDPCVMTDLRQGEYQLVKHLLSRGKTRIHLITGNRELQFSKLRIEGYVQAYQEMNLMYQPSWIIETVPDFEHGLAVAENSLTDLPDAFVCVNDYLAMGVLKALKQHGIGVPQDVSVAGYDDLLFSSIVETPLTTVKQPIEKICRKSAEILMNQIEGKKEEAILHSFQPELILRDSTPN